jgi:hypothetical protein
MPLDSKLIKKILNHIYIYIWNSFNVTEKPSNNIKKKKKKISFIGES